MSPRNSLPLPTGRGWWLVVAGLAAGLVLFLALWLGEGDRSPYQVDGQSPAAVSPVFQPLPAPPATGLDTRELPPGIPSNASRIEEPEAPPSGPVPASRPLDPPDHGDGPVATTGRATSAPVPVSTPGPRYPARALRRREGGEVLLRVQVDARGLPARVEVASSSGSRDLDNAASRAVRGWRFRPATQDGQPVAGVVNVPVSFDSGR